MASGGKADRVEREAGERDARKSARKTRAEGVKRRPSRAVSRARESDGGPRVRDYPR